MKQIKKTKKYAQILSRTFLFRGVDTELVEYAYNSPRCTCAEFENGEYVYTRKNFKRSIGIVLSGGLKAVKIRASGQEILLNTFENGGIFGVAGLFNSSCRYVSDIIAMRRSKVLFLSQPLIKDLIYKDPHVAENYISFLSGRVRYLNTCIDHFTCGSAEARLARFLLALQEEGENVVELPCSLQQLSDTLGIGRASLYRALNAMTEYGLIRRTGRRVEILNSESLRNV
ncbi:MAG: Crp/Fnr family transcriptional regulator [Oscillospiraceae bacterium]|jgi:CRP-like cAMP-binding protein